MNGDTLGVASYWDALDYLDLENDKKKAKREARPDPDPHTPTSKYASPETAFLVSQFKSPRAQHDSDLTPRASGVTI